MRRRLTTGMLTALVLLVAATTAYAAVGLAPARPGADDLPLVKTTRIASLPATITPGGTAVAGPAVPAENVDAPPASSSTPRTSPRTTGTSGSSGSSGSSKRPVVSKPPPPPSSTDDDDDDDREVVKPPLHEHDDEDEEEHDEEPKSR